MTDKTEQEWIAIIKNSITLPAYQNMPITIDQGTVRYLNLYGLSGLHFSYQKGYVESSISINLNASGNLPSIQTSGNTGVNVELAV